MARRGADAVAVSGCELLIVFVQVAGGPWGCCAGGYAGSEHAAV